MFDYKIVEAKLNNALSLVEQILPKQYIDMVRADIEQGGEWVLALETLCDSFIEDNLPVPHKVYKLLEEVAALLNMKDRQRLDVLKLQVISDPSS